MRKKAAGLPKKYVWLFGCAGVAAVALIAILLGQLYRPGPADSPPISVQQKLESMTDAYTRGMEPEEYDFYYGLVRRDLPADTGEAALAEKTKEKASRAIAEFSLGQKLGLCQPYSFESLQRAMEKENEQRKLKKENGEVVYGPQKFELNAYFNYVISNLKLDVVDAIKEGADDALQQKAKAYFEENRAEYQEISNIRYTITEEGITEEKNLPREEMRTLERTDDQLFEFLYYGQAGDTMDYLYGDKERSVRILALDRADPDFDSVQAAALEDYISEVYYEELVQKERERIQIDFPSEAN